MVNKANGGGEIECKDLLFIMIKYIQALLGVIFFLIAELKLLTYENQSTSFKISVIHSFLLYKLLN